MRLSFATALVLGFFAAPGLSKSEPVVLDGTTWELTGRSKGTVQRLGSDWDDETLTLEFPGGNAWTSVDHEDNPAGGTFVTRGRKANKFDATLDGGGVAATRAWMEEWIEGALADEGLDSAVTVTITASKIKGNVTRGGTRLKVRILHKFTADATDIGETARGQYKVTLRGGPIVE